MMTLRTSIHPWLGILLPTTLLLVTQTACGAQPAPAPPAATADDEIYSQQTPSRDGTGKVYMGREIAFVMGYQGLGWLERSSRETSEMPDRVVDALGLKPNDVVADLGAGSGYFALRIAQQVPQGKVLAVDIQPEMLEVLEKRAAEQGVNNVAPVLSTETNPRLPEAAVDLVLMVDAYHEFSHPREIMEGVVRALKPGGRVALVEYRGEDPSVPIKETHKMTQAQARREMAAVGLSWRETLDFLPQQHLMIFEKPASSETESSHTSDPS